MSQTVGLDEPLSRNNFKGNISKENIRVSTCNNIYLSFGYPFPDAAASMDIPPRA